MNNKVIDEILNNWKHKRTYPVIKKLIEKYNVKSFIELGLGTPGLSTSILHDFSDINIIGIDIKKNNLYYELEKIFNNRFKFICAKSFDALKHIDTKSIDMIYIDGSHKYEDILLDLQMSIQIVKNNGIISGHDYGNKKWIDVKKAVDEIISIYNSKLFKEDYLNYYFINERNLWDLKN